MDGQLMDYMINETLGIRTDYGFEAGQYVVETYVLPSLPTPLLTAVIFKGSLEDCNRIFMRAAGNPKTGIRYHG